MVDGLSLLNVNVCRVWRLAVLTGARARANIRIRNTRLC